MPDFIVSDAELRYTQGRVYREMVLWMAIVGALLIWAPRNRFGPSWALITSWSYGPDLFGVFYLVVAILLGWAVYRGDDQRMGWTLLAAGMMNWTLGVFLLLGALHGPTGLLGAPFTLYVGRHMLIHSATLTTRRPWDH